MNREIKWGAIISYLNIVLNMAISIFLTPYLIRTLGDSAYGVYRIIQSFSGQLTIVSFGVTPLIVRNVVYYNTKGLQEEKENFLFFAKAITFATGLLITIIGVGFYPLVPLIYGESLLAEEIQLAQTLLIFLVINLALSVVSDSYIGIITAREKFAVANGSKAIRLILRVALIVILVEMGVSAIGVVLADCLSSLTLLVFSVVYGRVVLKERSTYHRFDKMLIKQCASFSAAIFLQSIATQTNQNLDNIILGFMTDTKTVTMYSVALALFTSFNTLVSSVGGLFGPKATRLVTNGATGEELTDFVVRPGRFQLMIAGLAIGGFLLFGQDFIRVWVGDSFLPAYTVTIILLVPAVIPLIETVTLSILDALLKRLGRSLILVGMCVVNIIVSVVLIDCIGYIGAAIGTAVSFVIGYGVLLNIYLHRVAKLNIIRMFREIFKGIFPAILVSLVVGFPLRFLSSGLMNLMIKCVCFALAYCGIMYVVGMNPFERDVVKSFLKLKKDAKKT